MLGVQLALKLGHSFSDWGEGLHYLGSFPQLWSWMNFKNFHYGGFSLETFLEHLSWRLRQH